MAVVTSLHSVVLECPDPAALAGFYQDLTGWVVADSEPDWVTLRESKDDGERVSFQRAPGYQPPTWPDPASSMQFHIDWIVEDLDSAEREALRLGATKNEHQPAPTSFRVFADPAGHPFCLCAA